MNVLNQNRKELEEMLVGSNSDPVTTTLRDLHNFKTTLPILQVLERDPHSSAFLSQRIEIPIPLPFCHKEFPGYLGRLSDPIYHMRVNRIYRLN